MLLSLNEEVAMRRKSYQKETPKPKKLPIQVKATKSTSSASS
jgi:hypothetical protein